MRKTKTDSIKTVLTLSVGFIIVYLITNWSWAISVSIIIGIIGIFSNFISEKITFLWMKLTWLLSLIVPNILLSIIFFLLLWPIAILARLFGKKDAINLKNRSGSLFKNRIKQFDKSSFEKVW